MPKITLEFEELDGSPNLPHIDAIYAVLAVQDGSEGLPAMKLGEQWYPMIAADKQRLDQILAAAKQMARHNPKIRLEVVKFTTRETIEIIEP